MQWVVSKRRTAVSSGVPAKTSPSRPSLWPTKSCFDFRSLPLSLSGEHPTLHQHPPLLRTSALSGRWSSRMCPSGRDSLGLRCCGTHHKSSCLMSKSSKHCLPSQRNLSSLVCLFLAARGNNGVQRADHQLQSSPRRRLRVYHFKLLCCVIGVACLRHCRAFDQGNSSSMTVVLSLFDSSNCSRTLTRCLPASRISW